MAEAYCRDIASQATAVSFDNLNTLFLHAKISNQQEIKQEEENDKYFIRNLFRPEAVVGSFILREYCFHSIVICVALAMRGRLGF
ncbi:MAG: hypothetical protein H6872_02855 [Methylobacteriaceae bacterium]|nr:hypothetical protein [Methylobacteriaceae bacterium]